MTIQPNLTTLQEDRLAAQDKLRLFTPTRLFLSHQGLFGFVCSHMCGCSNRFVHILRLLKCSRQLLNHMNIRLNQAAALIPNSSIWPNLLMAFQLPNNSFNFSIESRHLEAAPYRSPCTRNFKEASSKILEFSATI